MHLTNEIIDEVASLPIDERVLLADAVLRTLNTPNAELDSAWADIAGHRLAEVQAGTVNLIPLEEVVAEVQGRFAR